MLATWRAISLSFQPSSAAMILAARSIAAASSWGRRIASLQRASGLRRDQIDAFFGDVARRRPLAADRRDQIADAALRRMIDDLCLAAGVVAVLRAVIDQRSQAGIG